MIIEEISITGINYVDNAGNNATLSFSECNENWLAYRRRTENLNEPQIVELRRKDKTVGQRDIDAEKSYIEFFTRPFTRFEFDSKKQRKEYENLRNSIWKYGWTTCDLS